MNLTHFHFKLSSISILKRRVQEQSCLDHGSIERHRRGVGLLTGPKESTTRPFWDRSRQIGASESALHWYDTISLCERGRCSRESQVIAPRAHLPTRLRTML